MLYFKAISTRPGAWLRSTILLLTCWLLGGCGLAEYEARMEMQQRRMRYAEEQNAHLEPNSVRIRERKGDNALPPDDFYLRPPKGISTTAESKFFSKAELSVFKASSAESPFQELLVSATKGDKLGSIIGPVLEALKVDNRGKKSKDVGPLGAKRMQFDWYRDESVAGKVDVFFRQDGPYLVAIAFRSKRSTEAGSIDAPIDYSLGSLKLGFDARRARGAAPKSSGKSDNPAKN